MTRSTRARAFVIVDNLWHNWAALNIPPLLPMLDDIETHWTLVFESGQIRVYENPKR